MIHHIVQLIIGIVVLATGISVAYSVTFLWEYMKLRMPMALEILFAVIGWIIIIFWVIIGVVIVVNQIVPIAKFITKT